MDETQPDALGDVLEGALLAKRYEVLSRLGTGGMASIYLAIDHTLSRKVVIKVPLRELLLQDDFRTRFLREVGSLSQLQHPNIVRIQDLGEHEGFPFAVLDYLSGGDLKQVVTEAGGTVSVEQVALWLPPICRGLDFIHSKGTLHRDVKPENILFDERGQVSLSDFGIATTIRNLEADATIDGAEVLTVVGGFIGSPNFAPPEAIHRDLTPAYDQYSVGVTVYLALCGSYPIAPRTTYEATLVAKASEDPVPIADRLPGLPPPVARVVMRSLARTPGDRFPSCGAFADAFVEAVSATRASPPRRRGRLWAALVCIAGLAIVWGFWQVSRGPAPPIQVASDRTVRPRTTERLPLAPVPDLDSAPAPTPAPVPSAERRRTEESAPTAAPRSEPHPQSPKAAGPPAPTQPRPSVVSTAAPRLEPIEGMVGVASGRFLAGCNLKVDRECEGDEGPSVYRELSDFWLDKTEVTVAAYGQCVSAGACSPPGQTEGCNWGDPRKDDYPINCVDWTQATAYCAFAGKRLPSEWEWEKAARGPDGRKYPWGDRSFERAGRVANIADASLEREREGWVLEPGYDDGRAGTGPVGTYPAGASPTGALDMIGNVWEWTSSAPDGRPGVRIIRGGSWNDPAADARASFRSWSDVEHQRSAGGFRCARSKEEGTALQSRSPSRDPILGASSQSATSSAINSAAR